MAQLLCYRLITYMQKKRILNTFFGVGKVNLVLSDKKANAYRLNESKKSTELKGKKETFTVTEDEEKVAQ